MIIMYTLSRENTRDAEVTVFVCCAVVLASLHLES